MTATANKAWMVYHPSLEVIWTTILEIMYQVQIHYVENLAENVKLLRLTSKILLLAVFTNNLFCMLKCFKYNIWYHHLITNDFQSYGPITNTINVLSWGRHDFEPLECSFFQGLPVVRMRNFDELISPLPKALAEQAGHSKLSYNVVNVSPCGDNSSSYKQIEVD